MQNFTNGQFKLFEHIARLSQSSLKKVMTDFLSTKYDKVVSTPDYTYAIGNIPIALVAHLDTVYDPKGQTIYYDSRKGVIWSPTGLGADDRAGVFAIIEIIKAGYRPTVIVTTEEEMGGIGARIFTKEVPKAPTDLKYVVELDRRGAIDCVFYECDNPEFEEYVESFGFTTEWGTYTDICEICEAWKVAGVNLSVGYENEHTKSEILKTGWLNKTIQKVITMIQDINNAKHYKYIPSEYSKYYSLSGGWHWGNGSKSDIKIQCSHCQQIYDDFEICPVKSKDGMKTRYYCSNCIGLVSWCNVCQELFETPEDNPNATLCIDCDAKRKEWKYGKYTKSV